jgi:hypothetical protein
LLLVPNVSVVRPLHTDEIADAVNVTGGRLAAEAVSEFPPTELPRVQLPTAAMPDAFVTAGEPVIDPPPEATAKFTVIPDFGLPFASRTITEGAIGTAFPMAAAWLSPEFFASVAAGPEVDDALNETAPNDPVVALRTFAPTIGPRVHEPTVAMPAAFVMAPAPATDPPPDATVKVTVTPGVGLPFASFTRTDG